MFSLRSWGIRLPQRYFPTAKRFTHSLSASELSSLCCETLSPGVAADYSLVCVDEAPNLVARLQSAGKKFPIAVYPDFVTQAESDLLVKDLLLQLNRKKYNTDHWDQVITGVRSARPCVSV